MFGVWEVTMTTSRNVLALSLTAILWTVPGFAASRERFLLEEGKDLYNAAKYNEAIAHFEELLERDPANWPANYLTAASYFALYHPGSEDPTDKDCAEKGVVAVERALELAAPSPEERAHAERLYVTFLFSIGMRDKAIAYVEKLLVSHPDNVELMHQLATLYQKMGEYTKALEYFERRASLDFNNKEAWYTLGVNCWARSYHGGIAVSQDEREQVVEKGIRSLEKAIAIDRDYFDAIAYINLLYRERAKALDAVERTVEAREAYEKAAEFQQRAIDLRNEQSALAKAN